MTNSSEKSKRSKRAEQARRLAWLEAQAPLGWAIILVLAALLGTIYLGQASRTAAVGRHVRNLQSELDEIKRQNAILERDIAEAQSLDRLQDEAKRLGFRPSTPLDIEYLIVEDYPVLVRATPVPEATPLPDPIETVGEALWLSLKSNITSLVRGESSDQ